MKKVLSSLLLFLAVFYNNVFSQAVAPSNTDVILAPMEMAGNSQKNYVILRQGNPIVVPNNKGNTPQFQASPANDDCSNAISLTVDGACVNGTTKQSSTENGENFGCQGSPDQSVWYTFVATSSNMFVEVDLTSSSGCYLSSAVWSGSCLPSVNLSCQDAANGPNLNIHSLTGLTVGDTYYIQVSYTTGAVCGNSNKNTTGADFCIDVGNSVICSACNNTCGALCVFGTQPTVAQVTSTCSAYDLKPRMNAGDSRTECYTFTANSTTFNMQMIIQSIGCSGGNVTAFNWTLQATDCGADLRTGDLNNLNATGLTIGQAYILCYTWTAACEHDAVWPYIVSNVPLPVELIDFHGTFELNHVELEWSTASEINNNYFSIERSTDGKIFEKIGKVAGAGNSTQLIDYSFNDMQPLTGVSYYRLQQTDYNGLVSYSPVIAVSSEGKDFVKVFPNPVKDQLFINVNAATEDKLSLSVYNLMEQQVLFNAAHVNSGFNQINIDLTNLSKGVYFLKIGYKANVISELIMKE